MTAASPRTDPYRAMKLAEQCFALAHSTTYPAERATAIERGIAIAEKAGLTLDWFDIPGRARQRPAPPPRPAPRDLPSMTDEELDDMLERAKRTRASWQADPEYREARHRVWADAIARARESREAQDASDPTCDGSQTAYDARRRAFDEACAAAAEMDRANGRRAADAPDAEALRRASLRDRWPSTGAAINALRARRVIVHLAEDPDHPGEQRWFTQSRGLEALDEWQLRELADEVCG